MPLRRPQIFPGNDNIAYVNGLFDVDDPLNADGSPKWINNASGTWTLIDPNGQVTREGIIASGVVVASGNVTAVGSGGQYKVELGNTLNITSVLDYYLRVVLTTPTTGFKIDLMDSINSLMRTGKTPAT